MKKIFLLCVSLFFALVTIGCQSSQTRTAEGAAIGGLLGAAAGGIIGHQSHHGGEGAAIGAAAGALTGAVIGSQIQKPGQAAVPVASTPAQTMNPNQMSLQQIVELTRQGVNEEVIIDKMRLTNSKFNLTVDDIRYLTQQGVSQRVIDAMQTK